MSELEKFLKNVLLGGVGAVATAAEKASELARGLVDKGTRVMEENRETTDALTRRGQQLADDIAAQMRKAWDGVCQAVTGKAQPTREERDEVRERLNEMDELEEELTTLEQGLNALMRHVGDAMNRAGEMVDRVAGHVSERLDGLQDQPESDDDVAKEAADIAEEAAAEADEAAKEAADRAEAGEAPQGGRTMEEEIRSALQYIKSRIEGPDGETHPELQELRQRLLNFARDAYSAYQGTIRENPPQETAEEPRPDAESAGENGSGDEGNG